MIKINRYILFSIFLFAFSILPVFANDVSGIRDEAKILYMAGKIPEAQKKIAEILPEQRSAFDYFLIGNMLSDEQLKVKAYEKAIALDDKYYQAYYNLGDYYFEIKEYDKAIDYLEKAINAKKDFHYGYYNLGCVYLKLKNYNKARKAFSNAIKYNPQEPDYYYNLGYVYKQLGSTKRADKAIALYNELIKQRNEKD